MRIPSWFSDGHPQKYHVAALFFAVIALGSAATTTILAEDIEISGTACVYSYSDWGNCQSTGKRTRTVTGYSPTGCVQVTQPSLVESCTYTAPVAPQCVYAYSSWEACRSDGRQVRSVVSRSPSGCQEYTHPLLEQSCTYVTQSSGQSCVYSYSDWGVCQSTGKRTRTVTGYSPTGCVQTAAPYTVESCTYSSGSNTSETVTVTQCAYAYSSWGVCQSTGKRTRTVTGYSPTGCVQTAAPYTVESCTYSSGGDTSVTGTTAPQCIYAYSGWGACQSTGKRTRSLVSKSPSDCVEYTQPAFEQSCIYDTAVASTGTVIQETSTLNSQTETGVSGTGIVTPAFSFLNVGEGMVFRDTFEIKGDVRGAQNVEYYLVPIGSNTYKYIGKGSQVSSTGWNLRFSSKEFPNGEFYLRVKVKNIYGEYGSGQRKIVIANQDAGTVEGISSDDGFIPFEMNRTQKLIMMQKMEEEFQIPKDEAVNTSDGNPDQQRKRIFDYCQTQPEKCFPERDSDKDGLSDIDEVRYGSDPRAADSDLDGFIDGDEVKSGFDPVKYSPGDQSDRIVFESPKTNGEIKQNYAIRNVSVKPSENGEQKLRLEGKGLPNSFVTIYIYSDPIVLTVKTDSEGNWTYELDKNLEDGNHEAYVAVTDNTGKITAKSEPIAFVKTAQAVTVIPEVEAATVADTLPVTQSNAKRDLLLLVSLIAAAVAVGLATIGFIKHKRGTDVSGETTL